MVNKLRRLIRLILPVRVILLALLVGVVHAEHFLLVGNDPGLVEVNGDGPMNRISQPGWWRQS